MKKLIKQLFIFLIPIFFVCLGIVIVDPYDYFGLSPFKGDNIKQKIAKADDSSRRIRLVNFKKNPQKNVIIGASQIGHINTDSIPSRNWANIANGGANIDDEITTFWQISKDYPLDTVLFSIEPYNYTVSTGYNTHQMMTDAYKMIENPLFYFVDRYVYKTTISFVLSLLRGEKNKIKLSEEPEQNRDAFWRSQLDVAERNLLMTKEHPDLLHKIREMVDYCHLNNICMICVIPISHTDIYYIYKDYMDQVLLPEITKEFDVVYNFMLPNSFTEDKRNFGDPLHAHGENFIYMNGLFYETLDTTYLKIYKKNER